MRSQTHLGAVLRMIDRAQGCPIKRSVVSVGKYPLSGVTKPQTNFCKIMRLMAEFSAPLLVQESVLQSLAHPFCSDVRNE